MQDLLKVHLEHYSFGRALVSSSSLSSISRSVWALAWRLLQWLVRQLDDEGTYGGVWIDRSASEVCRPVQHGIHATRGTAEKTSRCDRTIDLLLTMGFRSASWPGISPEGQIGGSASARLGQAQGGSRRMRPPRFLPTGHGGGAHARPRVRQARSLCSTCAVALAPVARDVARTFGTGVGWAHLLAAAAGGRGQDDDRVRGCLRPASGWTASSVHIVTNPDSNTCTILSACTVPPAGTRPRSDPRAGASSGHSATSPGMPGRRPRWLACSHQRGNRAPRHEPSQ